MRLVTYASDRGPRAGVQTNAGVIDAWDLIGGEAGGSLRELIASGRVDEVKSAIEAGEGEAITPGPGAILAPIPDPDKIICVGLNYRAHAEETGMELPKAPTIFGKYRNALVPDGACPQPAARSTTRPRWPSSSAGVPARSASRTPSITSPATRC